MSPRTTPAAPTNPALNLAASAAANPAAALAPYDGPWTEAHAGHLLRRALGGASRVEVAAAAERTPAAALDALFVRDEATAATEAGWAAVGERLARGGERAPLAAWWLMKLVRDGRATGSRLALVLHDHFACTWSKTADPLALYEQHQLFVERGGGPFGALLGEVVRGPAMLRFLDGDRNRRGAPNENLAREVLELFTLGVGHYTEADIREAARALTGWTVRDGRFAAVRAHHDPRPKLVLGTPVEDGSDVCRVAAGQPRCARFLVAKFWSAYVSPTPPPGVVELLAERWRAQELDVAWLLRALLGSRAFHEPAARRSLVKSPVEFVVGALRACGGTLDLVEAERACADMGQQLFEPPGVQGWAGGEAWIHAAAWMARLRFARRLATGLDDATVDGLFDGGGGLLARLFDDEAGDDATRALELVGLAELGPARADALRAAVPSGTSGRARRRDLLHAALALPEAHLS